MNGWIIGYECITIWPDRNLAGGKYQYYPAWIRLTQDASYSMVNKSYFLILLTLIIFALIYIIREKRILVDNVSVILEELEEDAPEYRSKEKKLSLTKISYTEGLLEGQLYSFFGTGDLTSRNLSENQVKDIILERISERELHNYQNIEKNFVRTRRWPYNKKWFIGKLVIKLVK